MCNHDIFFCFFSYDYFWMRFSIVVSEMFGFLQVVGYYFEIEANIVDSTHHN